jgi:hypothetical protein
MEMTEALGSKKRSDSNRGHRERGGKKEDSNNKDGIASEKRDARRMAYLDKAHRACTSTVCAEGSEMDAENVADEGVMDAKNGTSECGRR